MAEADEYDISADPARLDLGAIHAFLAGESYWAGGIPFDVVERSVANSLCFGAYRGREQVGFARVVTDRATFALLADVFVLGPHRRRGLSKRLMEAVVAHPDLRGLRRMLLLTSDAHELYARFGFREIANAWRFMEVLRPDPYAVPPAG